MTRFTIIFFLAISISSCHNKADNTNDTSKAILNDAIIPFNGIWASEAYIRILKTTKSPRLSQDSGYFIQIPKSYKDKAFPYLYHEGGEEYHVMKYGNKFYLKSIDNASDSTEIMVAGNGTK